MNKVLKFKSVITIFIAFLLMFIQLFDYISISDNTIEYVNVYKISIKSEKWIYRSISNFKIWKLIQIVFFITYIVLNVIYILQLKRKIQKVLIFIECILFIFFIYSFVLWVISGYDH